MESPPVLFTEGELVRSVPGAPVEVNAEVEAGFLRPKELVAFPKGLPLKKFFTRLAALPELALGGLLIPDGDCVVPLDPFPVVVLIGAPPSVALLPVFVCTSSV